MSDDFFAYIYRMKYILRWSLMRSAEPENIQEHSHMTAVLAHCLGLIRKEIFGIDCNPEGLATAALFHDASEILTGDLPTPIKYHSSSIKSAYDEVEALAVKKLADTLPPELRGAYIPLLDGSNPDYILIKAADRLSALIKCIAERKAGNTEFISAEKTIRNKLGAMKLPELEYFKEHFLPGFEKALDELAVIEEPEG